MGLVLQWQNQGKEMTEEPKNELKMDDDFVSGIGNDFVIEYDPNKLSKDQENLRKYGRHLRSCELVLQPYLGSTNSYWSCDCGFSEALDCQLCKKKGYVVNLPVQNGYITGHCPECGNI